MKDKPEATKDTRKTKDKPRKEMKHKPRSREALLFLEEEFSGREELRRKLKIQAAEEKAAKEKAAKEKTESKEEDIEEIKVVEEEEISEVNEKDEIKPAELSKKQKKDELERTKEVLKKLTKLRNELVHKYPNSKVVDTLTETITEINAGVMEYNKAVSGVSNEDAIAFAQAKLLINTLGKLETLSDAAKLSKIHSLFADILPNSPEKIVRSNLKNEILERHYIQMVPMVPNNDHYETVMDYARSDLTLGFKYLGTLAKFTAGKIYQKMNPIKGFIVLTTYVRESVLGDKEKGEDKSQYYYTGEVEPQEDKNDLVINYFLTVFGGGLLQYLNTMGPIPFAAQALADEGRNAVLGLSKADFIPSQEKMVTSLDEAEKAEEKNCAHVFENHITGDHIKEIFIVNTQKTLQNSLWNEQHEKNLNTYKGRWLSDPFQVVYVVVPSDNPRLDTTNANQWKVAFYNKDAAIKFAELANKHPYWYDSLHGWNLTGWKEKMTARDHAVLAIEGVLRLYLTPGKFADFEVYLRDPEMLHLLPIYQELVELNHLVTRLMNYDVSIDFSDAQSDEQIAKSLKTMEETQKVVLKEIQETFDKIIRSIKENNSLVPILSALEKEIKNKFTSEKLAMEQKAMEKMEKLVKVEGPNI